MEWHQAILLGVVEGLTEFLPISSTGHLIVLARWLGQETAFTNMFSIAIQFGAILALPLVLGRRVLHPIPGATPPELIRFWSVVVLAVIPAAALGLALSDLIEEHLFHPGPVALALAAGGVALLGFDRRRDSGWGWDRLGPAQALVVGLIQCLALWPGVSRSAATILGALALGANRRTAAEFSFYLAIPVLGLASAYSLFKYVSRQGLALSAEEGVLLALGFGTSWLTAWLVCRWFLAWISQRSFGVFAYYRLALAAVVLITSLA